MGAGDGLVRHGGGRRRRWGGRHRFGRGDRRFRLHHRFRLLLDHEARRLAQRPVARLEHGDRRALADPVADGDQDAGHRARHGGGDVHRRLVGLQRDERVVDVDQVAYAHEHLDDGHVAVVADVGNPDLGRALFSGDHHRPPA